MIENLKTVALAVLILVGVWAGILVLPFVIAGLSVYLLVLLIRLIKAIKELDLEE